MITPAISVLSAVEGLGLAFDGIDHWVVPLSLVVLVGLFLIQKHGTAGSASCSGRSWSPGSWCWAPWGVWHQPAPGSAACAEPGLGRAFLHGAPGMGVAILGAVVLALTGAEALYADMGHFGRKPIARAWFIWCCRRWCSTTSARAPCCWKTRKRHATFLPAGAKLGADSAGGAGHPGHGDCLAGGDFRCVLPDPSGDPAGTSRACTSAHLQRRAGADLHRRGELVADGRRVLLVLGFESSGAWLRPTAWR
jgi:hypothetical protein